MKSFSIGELEETTKTQQAFQFLVELTNETTSFQSILLQNQNF